MRKVSLAFVASIVLISGTAFADSSRPQSQTTGNIDHGNQNCVLNGTYKNPGKMFQGQNLNPVQIVAIGAYQNVGDLIFQTCRLVSPN